jgi:hypothetical protein
LNFDFRQQQSRDSNRKFSEASLKLRPYLQRVETMKKGRLVMPRNRGELDSPLKRSFAEGGRWPIDFPSLWALRDMGLTVVQIARYFSIDSAEVRALLDRHGIQHSN